MMLMMLCRALIGQLAHLGSCCSFYIPQAVAAGISAPTLIITHHHCWQQRAAAASGQPARDVGPGVLHCHIARSVVQFP